jgi:hypothetical protein
VRSGGYRSTSSGGNGTSSTGSLSALSVSNWLDVSEESACEPPDGAVQSSSLSLLAATGCRRFCADRGWGSIFTRISVKTPNGRTRGRKPLDSNWCISYTLYG